MCSRLLVTAVLILRSNGLKSSAISIIENTNSSLLLPWDDNLLEELDNVTLMEDTRSGNRTQNQSAENQSAVVRRFYSGRLNHSNEALTITGVNLSDDENNLPESDYYIDLDAIYDDKITMPELKSPAKIKLQETKTNKTTPTTDAYQEETYDYYVNKEHLSRIRSNKSTMACWSCSSLVVRLCKDLLLHGLPKSWEKELWEDCPSGYCAHYEWSLDYGEGEVIAQRECVDEDPNTFCDTRQQILMLINTTLFGNCTTCQGHLCNKQSPVYVTNHLYFYVALAITAGLGYKYITGCLLPYLLHVY